MSREITIAGGGLAGLGLAIGLRSRGVPVTVLEAGSYPRHRVCGEFISGTSAGTLESLGIGDLLAGARLHHTVAWHRHGEAFHRDRLAAPALGISRLCLDERLSRHFQSIGGDLRTGIRASPDPGEGKVWAAGKKPAGGGWIGIKVHVKLEATADLEMHLGSNGYLGLAGVEDGWTNACGLFRTDRSIRETGVSLIADYLARGGQTHLAERIRTAPYRDGSFSAVAGFRLGRQPEQPDIFTVGDAGNLIPPFSGNGMSMALQGARMAMDPLLSWSRGEISWNHAVREIHHLSRKRFRTRMTASAAIHPLLMSGAGQGLIQALSKCGLLPFHSMLSLLR